MIDVIADSLGLPPLSEDILIYVNENVIPENEYNSQKGQLNSHYGRKHSEDSKKLMSEVAKNRNSKPMLGKTHSDETKNKIRQKAIGRTSARKGVSPWNKGVKTSDETKNKIRIANSGNVRSEEVKTLLSEIAKKRKRVVCEYCEREVDVSNYSRWHGDNCKHG